MPTASILGTMVAYNEMLSIIKLHNPIIASSWEVTQQIKYIIPQLTAHLWAPHWAK